MASEFSASRGVSVFGDGTGKQRYKKTLRAAPAGSNQVIYLMRPYASGFSSGSFTETVGTKAASYLGFSFTGDHIDTTDSTESEYDNFFGMALQDLTPFSVVQTRTDISSGDSTGDGSTSLGDSIGGGTNCVALSGAGSVLNSDVTASTNIEKPWTLPNEVIADKITVVWRVYTSLSDDSVLYEAWWNADSIDLETFDLTSINPDSPADQISKWAGTTYFTSGTIHGNTTGTNWRPETGVMAFPTHFLMRWGGSSKGIYLKNLLTHYSTLTT